MTLLLYVRYLDQKGTLELPMEATVRDLQQEVDKMFGSVLINYSGKPLVDGGVGAANVADTGLSQESTIDVLPLIHWKPRSTHVLRTTILKLESNQWNLSDEIVEYMKGVHLNEDVPNSFDIAHWDVSSITNMNGLFANTHPFRGDISQWDVSSVTDMRKMFSGASSFDICIGNWNFSPNLKTKNMFSNVSDFKQDITEFDISLILFDANNV